MASALQGFLEVELQLGIDERRSNLGLEVMELQLISSDRYFTFSKLLLHHPSGRAHNNRLLQFQWG